MNLLLSENVPLRTTRMLGDFAEDKVLPHRFGNLTAARFNLIRLSDTEFFAADHAMEVTGVFVADVSTDSWESELESDDVGNTYTIVRLAAPAPPDASVSAVGNGKRSPATGELLENPADLMEYICQLSGRTDIFPQLRAEAAAASIRLAGSITEARSIRAQLDHIAHSAGAIWTPQSARLYPVLAVSGYVIELEKLAVHNLTVSASLQSTADSLRLSYDECEATGKAQHYIQMTASPQRYGGVSLEVFLPWLRTPANAESITRRLLSRHAGELYDVTFTTDRIDIRPGQWTRLLANPAWPLPGADPDVMDIAVDIDPARKSVTITGETILAYPALRVTAHSIALSDTSEGGLEVEFRNGVATLTVRDDDGRPMQNARVALDGGISKRTNDQGKVSFATTSGPHELLIEAEGFETNSIQFTL